MEFLVCNDISWNLVWIIVSIFWNLVWMIVMYLVLESIFEHIGFRIYRMRVSHLGSRVGALPGFGRRHNWTLTGTSKGFHEKSKTLILSLNSRAIYRIFIFFFYHLGKFWRLALKEAFKIITTFFVSQYFVLFFIFIFLCSYSLTWIWTNFLFLRLCTNRFSWINSRVNVSYC